MCSTITRVLIAGAGAIGAMVAESIYRSGKFTVSVLASHTRFDRYSRSGFTINGRSVHLPLTRAGSGEQFDFVIIACKNHHLPEVLADLSTHIGEHTLILSLLNGISSEEDIARQYGEARLPYAMIIGTDAVRSGTSITYTKPGIIYFGDATNTPPYSERVRSIATFFGQAGIQCVIPENMRNRLWYKYMMNVALNQLTGITRSGYRILQTATRTESARVLFEAAMREVIAVAAERGIELGQADIDSIYRTLDTLSPDGKTSMCQDIEAGRKTEVELFGKKMMEMGAESGIAVPVNTYFYHTIMTIENGAKSVP